MSSLDFILSTGYKRDQTNNNKIHLLQEQSPVDELIKSDIFSIQDFDAISPKVSHS